MGREVPPSEAWSTLNPGDRVTGKAKYGNLRIDQAEVLYERLEADTCVKLVGGIVTPKETITKKLGIEAGEYRGAIKVDVLAVKEGLFSGEAEVAGQVLIFSGGAATGSIKCPNGLVEIHPGGYIQGDMLKAKELKLHPGAWIDVKELDVEKHNLNELFSARFQGALTMIPKSAQMKVLKGGRSDQGESAKEVNESAS